MPAGQLRLVRCDSTPHAGNSRGALSTELFGATRIGKKEQIGEKR